MLILKKAKKEPKIANKSQNRHIDNMGFISKEIVSWLEIWPPKIFFGLFWAILAILGAILGHLRPLERFYWLWIVQNWNLG